MVSVIVGIITIVSTILKVGWNSRDNFAKIELKMAEEKGAVLAEMAANREALLAMNRRIERLETKIL